MKKLRIIIITLVLSAITAAPGLAAGVREDNSNLLVWAFLAMCGLIIMVQLLPVIFMAFGIISGAVKGKRPEVKAANE